MGKILSRTGLILGYWKKDHLGHETTRVNRVVDEHFDTSHERFNLAAVIAFA
jgi:hypothetical protein